MIMTPLTAIVVNCAAGFLLYLLARYMTRCEARVALYHAQDYFLTHAKLTQKEAKLISQFTVIALDDMDGKLDLEE